VTEVINHSVLQKQPNPNPNSNSTLSKILHKKKGDATNSNSNTNTKPSLLVIANKDTKLINSSTEKKSNHNPNPDLITELTPAISSELFSDYIKEWGIILKSDLEPSDYPVIPPMSWSRSEINPDKPEFKFKLPTDGDFFKHQIAVTKWRIRRTLGPTSNFFRLLHRKREEGKRTAPVQVGLNNDQGTLFGMALIASLKGEASLSLNPIINTEMLFNSIFKILKKQLTGNPNPNPNPHSNPSSKPLTLKP
jgi:hypothetical protein